MVVWKASNKGLRILHVSTTSPIGEWAVKMDNGTVIRFPDKKKAQIREELRKRFL